MAAPLAPLCSCGHGAPPARARRPARRAAAAFVPRQRLGGLGGGGRRGPAAPARRAVRQFGADGAGRVGRRGRGARAALHVRARAARGPAGAALRLRRRRRALLAHLAIGPADARRAGAPARAGCCAQCRHELPRHPLPAAPRHPAAATRSGARRAGLRRAGHRRRRREVRLSRRPALRFPGEPALRALAAAAPGHRLLAAAAARAPSATALSAGRGLLARAAGHAERLLDRGGGGGSAAHARATGCAPQGARAGALRADRRGRRAVRGRRHAQPRSPAGASCTSSAA
jgi:hypothetical protein